MITVRDMLGRERTYRSWDDLNAEVAGSADRVAIYPDPPPWPLPWRRRWHERRTARCSDLVCACGEPSTFVQVTHLDPSWLLGGCAPLQEGFCRRCFCDDMSRDFVRLEEHWACGPRACDECTRSAGYYLSMTWTYRRRQTYKAVCPTCVALTLAAADTSGSCHHTVGGLAAALAAFDGRAIGPGPLFWDAFERPEARGA